ncbi:hypothetical protein [Streptomyces guryensis]|uniref:Uncharacterized protein n=1 Tax=Streptomyces guryensis TaxID=2886947 RepID=A0A9Q3ZFN8_9ACTN|nr:hypothetical protein [Streptomyces guryensis]MCD9880860.1 hypothetical protein [Streptomyces guryensis]
MESLGLSSEDVGWVEHWLEAHRLAVVSLSRGRHVALVVELHHLARVLGDVLPQPARAELVCASWARSWGTPSHLTDREALVMESR